MKRLRGCYAAALICFFSFSQLYSQNVAISDDGNYAGDNSAMLDVMSVDKGMLVPRMSTSLKEAIEDPATGLMVYDTELKAFCYFDGTTWQALTTRSYLDSLKQEIKLEIHAELGVSDIQGHHYSCIKIGSQVWMQENLKATRFNDGTDIPEVIDNATWAGLSTPACCWFFNDSAGYAGHCGALYNWYAVGAGNLCPEGWHVPSDSDWTTLTDYLGGVNVAGGKLKETGTLHWIPPNNGATNESGYTAIPGGFRHNGSFWDYGYNANWWTSTENTSSDCWARKIYHYGAYTYRDANLKNIGFSVRCLKD